jgi:catechol 2,3-dioxygenase-like lactoylglutathione lyase family enzyme
VSIILRGFATLGNGVFSLFTADLNRNRQFYKLGAELVTWYEIDQKENNRKKTKLEKHDML